MKDKAVATTEDRVLQSLAAIKTPSGQNLADSGRLSEIVIDGQNRVMFSISIAAADASQWEPVRSTVEKAIGALEGVGGVFVTLTEEVAPGSAASTRPVKQAPPTRNSAQTKPAMKTGQPIPGVRHIIAVASGKGGVGKSTTACNLALGLHALGLKVGILDADIYGPSMPKLFGLSGKPQVNANQMLEPLIGYGVKVMSIGFLVDEEAAMIWRGPMVMSAITQMLRDVAWGELDVLVVDMPPGTGDAQLTIAQATPLSGAVIVSTPQDLALIDARRGVTMFNQVEIPILGIIENMALFICPHCGQASHIFGHGGAREEAGRLNVPFLGEVPLHIGIRELSDSGRPVVATEPEGVHAKIYRDMAQIVWLSLKAGHGHAAPKIVVE